MAPDHVFETPMLRSFFDSGPFDLSTLVDHPDSALISKRKSTAGACIEVRHHVALFFQLLIRAFATFFLFLFVFLFGSQFILTRTRVIQLTWRLPHMIRTLLLIGMAAIVENDLLDFLRPPLLLCSAVSSF